MSQMLTTAALFFQLQADSSSIAAAVERVLGPMPQGLAGAAVVVVSGDRVVFSKGFGSAGRSGRVDPDRTLFRAASVAKLFVATAAMQLVAAGKLDLDRDIASYVPELDLGARAWPPVTMRQLLSHTAGVEDSFVGTIERVGPNPTTLAEHFRRSLPTMGSRPGEQLAYSNLGVALGALVIERIAGVPFAEVVAAGIFEPLAMTRSSYAEPLPAELRASVAGDTSMMKYRLIPYPAGSLVTTAHDMGRFVAAHLNSGSLGGRHILDSVHVAAMHSRVWSPNTRVPGVALGFFETELAGERVLFHTGSRGHHSALVLVPARRLGFYAVLDAQEGMASGLLEQLTQALLGATWAARAGAGTMQAVPVEQYAGRYRFNAGSGHTFEKLAKLAMGDVIVSRDSGGLVLHRERPMSLIPLGRDVFQTSDGMFVAFHRAADGAVDRMHAGGRLMDGASLDKLAFWENSTLHRVTLGGSFIFAWIATLVGAAAALWRLLRRRRVRAPIAWPRRLAGVATVTYALAPLPALIVLLTEHDATVVELTPAVGLVQGLVGIAALTALGAVLLVALGLGRSRPYRLRDGAFGFLAVAVIVLMGYWRVLPM